jgi:hypothetical protein
VEETALLVEVDNLHGLEDLGELTGGNVSVDIQHLAVGSLGERGEDRQAAGTNGSLNRRLVNTGDLADKLVLVLVEVLGVEDTSGNGARTSAEALESRCETEVLLEEDALGLEQLTFPTHASNLEGLGVGDADTVLVLGNNALSLKQLVQLGSSAVEDNRVQTQTVEERERQGEVVKLVGEDSATNPICKRLLRPYLPT